MSEDEAPNVAPEADNQAKPDEQPNEKPRPEKLPDDQEWDRVDFETADPQTIQRRFNRLWAQQRSTEAALKQAAEDNRAILERLNAAETKREEDSRAQQIAVLKAEKIKALEEGEAARAVEIDDQIIELRTQAKPEPKPKPEPKEEPGWFTPDRQRALQAWATETDDKGQLRRPWAHENHPKNARCIEITNGVLNDPDFAGADMEEILSEVDRLMTPRQRRAPAGAAVLSGGSAPRKSEKGGLQLSEEEKLVASRMYSHLPRAEAIKRYGESVAKLRGNQ